MSQSPSNCKGLLIKVFKRFDVCYCNMEEGALKGSLRLFHDRQKDCLTSLLYSMMMVQRPGL